MAAQHLYLQSIDLSGVSGVIAQPSSVGLSDHHLACRVTFVELLRFSSFLDIPEAIVAKFNRFVSATRRTCSRSSTWSPISTGSEASSERRPTSPRTSTGSTPRTALAPSSPSTGRAATTPSTTPVGGTTSTASAAS